MSDEEELGLAPMDDEDLQLVPVDDDAGKEIAPDVSHKSGIRLIPVICSACRTRLYAGENQVGLWKRCPVCERLNEIFPVDPKFMLTADDPEAEGGYEVSDEELSKRKMFRIGADYRTILGDEPDKDEDDYYYDVAPVAEEHKPLVDRMVDRFLKSDEERENDRRANEREENIQAKLTDIKRAVREGRLEEHLANSDNETSSQQGRTTIDPVARIQAERERAFKIASNDPLFKQSEIQTSSAKTIDATAAFAALDSALHTVKSGEPLNTNPCSSPGPPPYSPEPRSPSPTLSHDSEQTQPERGQESEQDLPDRIWSPLFDPRCRRRMIALTVFGFVGNVLGEKARSMIWQVLIDKVYGQSPGYSYGASENILLLSTFWIGGVLSILWIALLFLFGISLFEAAAKGRDRVDRWVPFDLDFGFSYIGWTFLLAYLASVPGQAIWLLVDSCVPGLNGFALFLQPVMLFFIFPVLFLCAIESDSFFGVWPAKTLAALRHRPRLWMKLYEKSALLVGLPFAVFGLLTYFGLRFDEIWVMQSWPYYLVAAVVLTVCGFGVLLYFRLLGRTMFEIRHKTRIP